MAPGAHHLWGGAGARSIGGVARRAKRRGCALLSNPGPWYWRRMRSSYKTAVRRPCGGAGRAPKPGQAAAPPRAGRRSGAPGARPRGVSARAAVAGAYRLLGRIENRAYGRCNGMVLYTRRPRRRARAWLVRLACAPAGRPLGRGRPWGGSCSATCYCIYRNAGACAECGGARQLRGGAAKRDPPPLPAFFRTNPAPSHLQRRGGRRGRRAGGRLASRREARPGPLARAHGAGAPWPSGSGGTCTWTTSTSSSRTDPAAVRIQTHARRTVSLNSN